MVIIEIRKGVFIVNTELIVSIFVSCITAFLSYLASRNKSKDDIAKIQIEYESKIKLLEKQNQADLELAKSQAMIPLIQDLIRRNISLDKLLELEKSLPKK